MTIFQFYMSHRFSSKTYAYYKIRVRENKMSNQEWTDCLRPVCCVPNVTSVSRLSSSCVLCAQRYQCLWIVFVLCLAYPTLPVSLDCLRPVSCVPMGKQDTERRQSRDTGNVGHTTHRTKTIQRHW
jgi:hypothetical protein